MTFTDEELRAMFDDERPPIEEFEPLKRVQGHTAAHEHAKFGRVVAVAYFDVTNGSGRVRLNAEINKVPFFDAQPLATFERRGEGTRFIVKLFPWKEGTIVRRWGNTSGSGRDDPRHSMTFVVRGDRLVRR
jgi:hypothetical protein